VLDNWYKSDADKKGVVLMVTTGKEGAVTGGKSFVEVGARLLNRQTCRLRAAAGAGGRAGCPRQRRSRRACSRTVVAMGPRGES
jgi:hypothetical protein